MKHRLFNMGDPGTNTIQSMVEDAVTDRVAPNIAVGVIDLYRAKDLDGRFVWSSGPRGAVFDLASLTKPLVTAHVFGKFVDRGWLEPSTPVMSIIPECSFRGVTMEHLLTHSAGMPAWKEISSWEDLFATPLEREVGVASVYSDLTYMLLGLALERVSGRRLDYLADVVAFGQRRSDLQYRVDQVNDANALRMGKALGQPMGHAGLFGSVDAVLDQIARLWCGDLSPSTIQWMWTRARLKDGTLSDRTPGWDTPSGPSPSSGQYFSNRSIGHLGFTGTSLWIDIKQAVAICVLTDRVAYGEDKTKIQSFRPKIHDAVMRWMLAKRS